jgi:hypothetical protein
MKVGTLSDGSKGFDANRRIDAASAQTAYAMGYRFAVRYIRRDPVNPRDVTPGEMCTLLEAGLGVMVVQHVAAEDHWTPTPGLGTQYGSTAVAECNRIGLPRGVSVWLDLEGVAPGTAAQDAIDYCNRWYDAVAGAGYAAGTYVGWHAGMSGEQLYRKLKCPRFWGAYNANADQAPIRRGFQMRQRSATAADRFPLVAHDSDFDVNVINADALGGSPSLLLPG